MSYKFILFIVLCVSPKLSLADEIYDYANADLALDSAKSGEDSDSFNSGSDRSIIDDSPSNEKNPELSDHREDGTPFIMSRFVGTFIGFGLGHLMQGRWLRTGWIYTIADLATLPVISDPWPLYGRDEHYKKGLGAYLLIKTIEIYDVWSFKEATTTTTVKPVSFFHNKNRHYGFALSKSF